MLIKHFFRILKDYKFSVFIIFFYEFYYVLRGFKGNDFNFSQNTLMSDDIPTPYYFLKKIKNKIKFLKFKRFIDVGCGSGRVLFYMSNFFSKKKYFIGVEYYKNQFLYAKNLFRNKNNINVFHKDFTKNNFNYNDLDCFFFNNPFKKEKKFILFINNFIAKIKKKKKILFIFVNFTYPCLKKIKKIKLISTLYVSRNKGFAIYILN